MKMPIFRAENYHYFKSLLRNTIKKSNDQIFILVYSLYKYDKT